jgi:succinyl-diaminopimelate desuccinylase
VPATPAPAADHALLDLLASLIAIDSTSGSPGEEQGLVAVAEWFGSCEAAVATVHRADDGSARCLTVLPVAKTTPLLLFSAHIDVVPVTRPEEWTHAPFGAEIHGGRMYGRGSSDMKSGLAAAMIATRELLESGVAVALAVSTGEEIGCRGAADVARALDGWAIGAVIIPESTANTVVLGHRGALWLTVETAGTAAHGSTPERGDNAILSMGRLLATLDQLPLGSHPELGRETVNVGTITGGTVPNIVPDSCTVELDLRLAGTDPETIVTWLSAQPAVASVTVDLDLSVVWTDAQSPWLASLGSPVNSLPAAYYTDASVLVSSLPPATPIVVWGPGDPAVVHSVEESVEIDAVYEAAKLYLSAGQRWSTAS